MADLRVPDIPLASCDDDDIDSNKNLSNHSSDEKHHCNSNSDEERLHDEFSGSLEDLVGNFDEKIAACLKDHEVTTADIAPVQIRTQEEVMNESQTWWTLTGNFGNIQPLDFGTSSICKKMAAALDSDSLKDDASTRRSMTNSDDEDLLRQQMDVHQMIGHHHGSTDTGGETPPQTADQVIEEIDEMLQSTMVSKGEELIKENMHMKLYMEGTVNNHHFKCTSEGEGKPYEGTQTMRIKVVEGGPLPFAFDILATSFMYGSRTFINHTQGIPDFFKQSFPEGFTWERVTTYEDGGVLTATQDTSLQDGCLIYNVKIRGVNFPSNGPVMQKKTLGWEANTEMLYPADGGLEGRSDMALKLVGGGHLICNFKTTYRSKKPAKNLKMPGVYYVDHRLERIKEADKETYVEQHEVAVARYCDLPSKLGHKLN